MNPSAALYQIIGARRDVRNEFTGAPADPDTLERILTAAHAAPSVGLSQPWDFVVIDDRALRDRFRVHVLAQREAFAASLPPERARLFDGIRIEGITSASLAIVVTYDPTRGAPHVLGRHTIDDAGLYSVCLAIENLWLAATAEAWGVGWVSFYDERFLHGLLGLPERVRSVAWLCVGPVSHLETEPDLERKRWARRRPLAQVVHRNGWAERSELERSSGPSGPAAEPPGADEPAPVPATTGA
jgi:5,6-dimethylbenzimidazole synthase